MISEAPNRDKEASQRREPPIAQPERQHAARTWQKPLDDEIPF